MTQLVLPRRKFLSGGLALLAAPAIVRASSLMQIKPERVVAVHIHPASGMEISEETLQMLVRLIQFAEAQLREYMVLNGEPRLPA